MVKRSLTPAPKDFASWSAGFEARLRAPETAERRAKSACLRLFTLIQVGYSRRALRVDRVKPPLLGAKRSFRMGVAGWRFAHRKRNLRRAGGRCRCARRLAGDLLGGGRGRLDDHDRDHALQRLAAVTTAGERLALDAACFPGRSELRLYDFTLLFDVVTITGLPAFITRGLASFRRQQHARTHEVGQVAREFPLPLLRVQGVSLSNCAG